ncbi:MAG: hypothetical protein I3273_05990 [Candidatus Moeniiplasma glomeromycotorum]|nr:hypothetical protein [Candidatus Moeniiplasma glomeromycotorum]MCE8168091.1 hypothetical protein [Candidatus Moeniiplasma glomeromycotorum]MCE8169635.1 hypothetical protein [Candidatus Moeniiplasma glomeromycotorum]
MVSKNKNYFINNIKTQDPLREKKLQGLENINSYLKGIDKEIRLEILEKHLWKIISNYKLSKQAKDSDLREMSSDFENDWPQEIVKATDGGKINKIYGVINRAIMSGSGLLTQEIGEMRGKTFAEVWARTDFENGKERGVFSEFSSPEKSTILREKLAKFEAKFPFSVNNGDWEKELVRSMLRDELVARINDSSEWEKEKAGKEKEAETGLKIIHQEKFDRVMEILRSAKFSQSKKNKKVIWKVSVGEEDYGVDCFRDFVQRLINSDRLKNEWLPGRTKKEDLLGKLETFIQAETSKSEVSDNSADQVSQNEPKNSDNSPKETAKPVKNEWEKLVEEAKNKAVKEITTALQKAGLSQDDLKDEYQNWKEQLKLAEEEGNATKIQDIESKLLADINNKKEFKENGAKLDNLLQKFQNADKTANKNEFKEAIKETNLNLGDQENEVKVQKVKEAMWEQDPELYFETFVNWVKEEIKTYEIKDNELEEKEKKLINGEITEPSEFKEIEKNLEKKLATKKHSWNFSQKLSEWQNWLRTTAVRLAANHLEEETKKIKRQIYSLKSSANSIKRQAYQQNEQKVNQLLAELNNVSQTSNQTTAPVEKGFWQPKVLIPTTLAIVGLIILVAVIIRKNKKRIKKGK